MAAYYRICPRCGAVLDPGEGCECISSEELAAEILGETPQGWDERPEPEVCRGCKSRKYCTSLCAAAEDELGARRR